MSPTINNEDVDFWSAPLIHPSVKILSWQNVLNSDHVRGRFDLSEFAGVATYLGYDYFIWNEIIYQKENGIWMRTYMSIHNVK